MEDIKTEWINSSERWSREKLISYVAGGRWQVATGPPVVRLDVKKDENLRDCSVLAIRLRENEHKK